MPWLSEEYRYRKLVTARTVAATDVQIPVIEQWRHLWANIDPGLEGLRMTLSDGVTPIVYQVGNVVAGESFTINCQGLPHPGVPDSVSSLWIYYGTDTPTDGQTAFAPASPVPAVIELGLPQYGSDQAGPITPGLNRPRTTVEKTPAHEGMVWFELPRLMHTDRPAGGRLNWEEPWFLVPSVEDAAGGDVPAMHDPARTRWASTVDGRIFAGVYIQGGSDGDKLTVRIRVGTRIPGLANPHQILDFSRGLIVSANRLT